MSQKGQLLKSNKFEVFIFSRLKPSGEYLDMVKKRVSEDMPNDIQSLKNSIRRHWRNLTVELILPYIDSMEQRFRQVIFNQGRRIKT